VSSSKTTITCERVEYYYNDSVKKMIATPRVKMVQEDKTVWANTAVFEDIPRLVTLTGDVVLTTDKGDEIRCLTVTDEFTKESHAIEVSSSFSALKVRGTLERLFQVHGRPNFIRSDNGGEFIADSLKDWLRLHGPQTYYIEPGSPWQNGVCESFNSKFRDECLNLEAFSSRTEARVIIEAWRRDYNEIRPHSSLGYLTPKEFRAAIDTAQLLGALPPAPRDLSPEAPPVSRETARAFPLAVTVRCLSAALRSLPSVALSFPIAMTLYLYMLLP
jgi:putative transposase